MSIEDLQGIACNSGEGTVRVTLTGGSTISLSCWYGCPTGQMECSPGSCTNMMTDEDNCGACGVACGDSESCEAGVCVAPTPSTCTIPAWAESDAEIIATMLSEARQDAGLGCLQLNAQLTQSAQAHATYMSNNPGTTYFEDPGVAGFTGHDFYGRFGAAGYHGRTGAEFIGWDSDAVSMAQTWIDDPAHREILLRPEFTDIGVGEDGGNWVADIGG